MIGFDSSWALFPTFPLIEWQTPLNANATVSMSKPFDTAAMVPRREVTPAYGGAGFSVYDVDHKGAGVVPEPRWVIHYSIYAVIAGVPLADIRCPGTLRIFTAAIDPATGQPGVTTPDSICIPYAGVNHEWRQTAVYSGTVSESTVPLMGSVAVHARHITVAYQNADQIQSTFLLGVYLRPV